MAPQPRIACTCKAWRRAWLQLLAEKAIFRPLRLLNSASEQASIIASPANEKMACCALPSGGLVVATHDPPAVSFFSAAGSLIRTQRADADADLEISRLGSWLTHAGDYVYYLCGRMSDVHDVCTYDLHTFTNAGGWLRQDCIAAVPRVLDFATTGSRHYFLMRLGTTFNYVIRIYGDIETVPYKEIAVGTKCSSIAVHGGRVYAACADQEPGEDGALLIYDAGNGFHLGTFTGGFYWPRRVVVVGDFLVLIEDHYCTCMNWPESPSRDDEFARRLFVLNLHEGVVSLRQVLRLRAPLGLCDPENVWPRRLDIDLNHVYPSLHGSMGHDSVVVGWVSEGSGSSEGGGPSRHTRRDREIRMLQQISCGNVAVV